MTNFGGRTIMDRQHEAEQGKAFFTPVWVADKLIKIMQNDSRDDEITLFPGDYGFGEWSRPWACRTGTSLKLDLQPLNKLLKFPIHRWIFERKLYLGLHVL